MDPKCYVHVPKTGGVSVEMALSIPHDHHRADASCNHTFVSVRDPIDRLSSAYHFCRQNPWDRVIRLQNWTSSHCCHSSVVRRHDFPSWLLSVLRGIDCKMPGAGYPHPFVAPTAYWIGNATNFTLIRTHCLRHDCAQILNLTIGVKNSSPSRNCEQNMTDASWHAFLRSAHVDDFTRVYGRRFSNVSQWRTACVRRECRR